ncbi:MAG: Holliday junction branch migration protein RuvA [Proteobacteria bacterium]|nr:Holliday junction branch migration protein RuvA [Pseudomonadota bacterium]
MIGQLRGILIEKKPPYLLLEVNGVGYWLQSPLTTFFSLPEVGQEIILRTHCIVREDAHVLYGFATQEVCSLFQEIIKINGVGPKIALSILSGLTVQEFSDVVLEQNISKLQCLPGIGAKIAQRILVEMQDKLLKWNTSKTSTKIFISPKADPKQDAIFALVSLGFKQAEAAKAVSKVQDTTQGCEYIVKAALQGLAKV